MTSNLTMKEKILVVDDDEGIQFFLGEVLRKKNYEVDSATSAEQALTKVRKEDYSLVLMDVRLPGMSGIAAIRKLKELDLAVPIIIMTAHGSKELAIQAVQEGAYDFFVKPIKIGIAHVST